MAWQTRKNKMIQYAAQLVENQRTATAPLGGDLLESLPT